MDSERAPPLSPLSDLKKLSNTSVYHHMHFTCTIRGPISSYSSFEIHACWNDESDEKIEPPIHVEYLRTRGGIKQVAKIGGESATKGKQAGGCGGWRLGRTCAPQQ